MNSFEKAFKEVKILVKNFKDNEKYYLSPSYSEIDARRDFIDKFFVALGWDVYHNTQKNPYEQEVRVEKGMYIADARKRADYSFSIAPKFRDTKFYVEAKKPSHDLSNADYYFQAIRYGFNAQNPIVILTDFEEFHIIDSRYSPNIKTALSFKLKNYHYTQYTKKEKFSEIYYLLSRECVELDSIEKYAETLKKPKGKAVQRGLFKRGYHSIDESFLEELDNIRERFARAFKKNNPKLDGEELTEAVQRTIDRLIFLRFLEDKLIEGETHIDKYGDKSTTWNDFINDCKKLEEKYNGIVFNKHFIDKPSFLPPDDSVFASICEEICIHNTKYLFNIIPIHLLGAIYEKFLGKIVKATAKQVKIEEKPEVRKAGGVYYTPQYIVKYIVDNTVGKILKNEDGVCHSRVIPASAGRNPENQPKKKTKELDDSKGTPGLKRAGMTRAGKIPVEISKLRFADISCGSGSFLITVYDTLLHYIGKWYQEHPVQAKKDGCILKDGQWVLSLKQKQEILLNNIYGVDIDSQAVEVTQLSLFLKLLEDETQASIQQEEMFYKHKILPDLSKNIVCGNSLIGTDIYEGNMFPTDEQRKINAMNFEDVFPEIMKNGGFDAIVGNPPWGSKDVLNKLELLYLSKTFKRNIHNLNIFALFIDVSLFIANHKGKIGYLIPKNFIKTKAYLPFRIDILKSHNFESVVDFGKFPKVAQESIAIFLETQSKTNFVKRYIYLNDTLEQLEELEVSQIEKDKFKVITLSKLTKIGNIIDMVFKNSFVIEDYFEVIRGMEHGRNGNLLQCDKCKNYQEKPGKKNKELSKIECKFCDNEIYLENKKNNHTFINKFKKNNNYNPLLIGNSIDRYELKTIQYYIESNLNGIDYKSLDKIPEKLYFIRIAKSFRGYYDNEYLLSLNALNVIYPKNKLGYSLKYLLGILNSRLYNIYADYNITSGAELTIRISNEIMKNTPIKVIDFTNSTEKFKHDKMVQLVDQMLEAKKQLQTAKTDNDKTYYERRCETLDRQIDQLVYELYGLTEEEVRIVEREE